MIERCLAAGLLTASIGFLIIGALGAQDQSSGTGSTKRTKGKRVVNLYHDPQDRFTFEIVNGGTVTASGDTVVIRFADTREVLQKVAAAPDAAIQQVLTNLPTPLKGLKEAERDNASFEGDGTYAIYTGKNAQGKDWVVKIVASKWGWVLIEDNIKQGNLLDFQGGTTQKSFKLTESGRADASNVPALPLAKDLPALTEALPPLDHPILDAAHARELAAQKQAILHAPAQPPNAAPAAAPQASAAAPAAEAGGFQYAVFSVSHMGVYYNMAVTDFIVLFPDGSAIGALPEQGMDGFNPQAWLQSLARKGPINNAVARYQMFTDHIELAYSNFTKSYGLPGTGANSLVPLCQCNGTRFAGVYAYGNLMVQFSPDGTFIDRGALDNIVMKNFGVPRAAQGQYALRYNTLYLAYSDGRQARISFAAPAVQENTGSFDWIALNQKTGRRVQ